MAKTLIPFYSNATNERVKNTQINPSPLAEKVPFQGLIFSQNLNRNIATKNSRSKIIGGKTIETKLNKNLCIYQLNFFEREIYNK